MRDFNDEIDPNTIISTEEDHLTYCNRSLAFREIQRWIETVTSIRFSHSDDFRRSLFDGILLCNLLNSLKPGSISRITKISTPLASYDNIGKFLRSCEEDFGLSSRIMFEISDLDDLSNKSSDMRTESDRRLQRVLICLFHLAKSVENQLTRVNIDPNPFSILLQSQDRKEMRRLTPNSVPKNSSQLSNIIHNQTPHYLATKAQETVNRIKINQENLHQKVDDEEWQESLENWKEKRRLVVSNPSLDEEHNDEGQELLELKEKARQMRSFREQLKEQIIPTVPLCNDKIPAGEKILIPDIDEETKAMIERVKQKKLAEELKRRFSVSPVHSSSFASDSEHSTSTTVDRHDEHIYDTIGKNEIDEVPSANDDVFQKSLSEHDFRHTEKSPDARGRLVTVKLIQRSKQDSDQLWGMALADGPSNIVISGVKIGSCADVCDIRKSDEIVSVNSEDVSNKSIEYIRNIFDQHAYMISNPETITICLRRSCNEDEEEEFYSDQSQAKDENDRHISVDGNCSQQFEELLDLDLVDVTTDLDAPPVSETVDNDGLCHETLEKARSPRDALTPEVLAKPAKDQPSPTLISANPLALSPEKEIARKLSVQEKIAKIESRSISNSMRLSSSWNVSGVNSIDPLFDKSTPSAGHSAEILSWNSDNLQYRQIGGSNSSLSNLYNYWDTDTSLKSPYACHVNGTAERHNDHEIEVAAQQQDSLSSSSGPLCVEDFGSIVAGHSPASAVQDTKMAVLHPCAVSVVNDPRGTTSSPTYRQADLGQDTRDHKTVAITTLITAPFENRSDQLNNLTRRMSDDETCSLTVSNMLYSQPDYCPSATESVLQNVDSSLVLNKNGIDNDYGQVTAVSRHNEYPRNVGPSSSLSTDSNGVGLSKDNENSLQTAIAKKPRLFPIRNTCLISKIIDKHNSASKSSDASTVSEISCVEESTRQSDSFKVTDLDNMTTSVKEVSRGILDSDKEGDTGGRKVFNKSPVTISVNQKTNKQPNVKMKNQHFNSNFDELSVENGVHPVANIANPSHKPRHFIATKDADTRVPVVYSSSVFKIGSQSDSTPSQVKMSSKSENVKSSKIESILSSRKVKNGNQHDSNTLPELKRSASSKELRFEDVPRDKKWNSLGHGDSKRTSSCSDVSRNGSSTNTKQRTTQYLPHSSNDTLPSTTNIKSHTKSYSIERSAKQASLSNKKVSQEPPTDTKSMSRCNFCSAFVGKEDLMVIEELNLHFHVKCFVCVECRHPLGDGKSDTDVRIRRSQLFCTICHSKRSPKAKHRNSSTSRRTSQTTTNVSQSKETEI